MRLLVLSDLHVEVWGDRLPLIDPVRRQPDAVILAGDIHTGSRAIQWATRIFPGLPVLYVMGNHEGYHERLDRVREDLRAACSASGHVHLLDCGELVLGSTRFLGATLWTDFRLHGGNVRQLAMLDAAAQLNDYRLVRLENFGNRRLRPTDTALWHQKHKRWLATKLSKPFPGKTVVITHMAPSARSVPSHYTSHPLSPAFASRLDSLVEQADLWIHGHLHDSVDYRIGNCRVVSNPCGYPRQGDLPENSSFDPAFIVDLG